MSARLQRVAALAAVWASLELLERIAYRAGVTDAGQVADEKLATLADPRDSDDDLQPADCSDVLEHHIACCGVFA